MNDISHTLGLLRSEVKDARAILSRLDQRQRRDRPRPGGLIARLAACQLFAKLERCQPADVARQHFADDRDLGQLLATKAASGPATTGAAGFAAELAAVIVADIADNLLPASTLAQLRAQGLQYMFVDGAVVRTPYHQPTPSGSFVAEANAISVGALLLSSFTLKPKKAAGIVAVTRELLAGTPINVEQSLRVLLSEDLGLTIDGILLGSGASSAAQPAGLLAGLSSLGATAGGGTNALLGDIKKLMNAITPAIKPTLIVNAVQAASIGILAQSAPPVIVSPFAPADQVICVDAAAFASSLGAVDFAVTEEAAINLSDTPLPIVGGTVQPPVIGSIAAPVSSTWQAALTALRTLIDVDWALRRPGAVSFISGTTW